MFGDNLKTIPAGVNAQAVLDEVGDTNNVTLRSERCESGLWTRDRERERSCAIRPAARSSEANVVRVDLYMSARCSCCEAVIVGGGVLGSFRSSCLAGGCLVA